MRNLIVLFGPDGSGKSSIAEALSERFSERGWRVRIGWMRGTHTLTSLIARLFSYFGSFEGRRNPYYGITIPEEHRRVWQLLEFVSALPKIVLEYLLPSLLGFKVVADRFTVDLVAWLAVTTRDEGFLGRFESRFLLRLASDAPVRVYVSAELDELVERGDRERWFVEEQLGVYERISDIVGAYRLDTTDRSVEESVRELEPLVYGSIE